MCSNLRRGSIHPSKSNAENSDWEEMPWSGAAFLYLFPKSSSAEWRDSFSLTPQFTDTLRLGFFSPSSHQLQLTCHAEYRGLLFSPCEMKTHGNAHWFLCAGRNKNLHTHTGKAPKIPIDPNRLRAIQFCFHYESNVGLCWSFFFVFLCPEVSRWRPSFTFSHIIQFESGCWCFSVSPFPICSSSGTVMDGDNW